MEENTMSRSDAEETVSVTADIQGGEPSDTDGQKTETPESTDDDFRTNDDREDKAVTEERTESRRTDRSGAEERMGKRSAGRGGAEERTGNRSASRTGAEKRMGNRSTGRGGAQERTGSRRTDRNGTEKRTENHRVNRSGTGERTGSRRVSRSETEERTGNRRVSRNETEERTENRRRVNQSEADKSVENRHVSRSRVEERTRNGDRDAERSIDRGHAAASLEKRSAAESAEPVPSTKAESGAKDHDAQSGKFGLGHQKTKRSAIVYLFEDIGDAFVRAKNWCVKNYRTSIPAAICLVLVIVVACILVRNFRQQPAPASEDMDIVEEYPLEKDAYEHINLFFERYYEACTLGDVDTYVSMRSYTDETECIRMQKKANYIDYYQNLSCYTKPGPVENTYLVYVYYEVKFRGINTPAPGLKTFYVCTNDAGELYIYSDEVDQNVKDYMRTVSLQEDVKDLFTRVKVTYKNAVASDKTLDDFLKVLSENLLNEVTEALKELEEQNQVADNSSGNAVPEEPEPTPEVPEEPVPEPEPQTDVVMTTDRVNVRSSASPEATKLGTVAAGTQFTRYESLENGWSKIDYEGNEAYIKTEYLQVIEAATGTVTTIESVNIRASASEDATKLGTVSAGTTLDLIENQENGWSRILFNGMTAYVKTEFVE